MEWDGDNLPGGPGSPSGGSTVSKVGVDSPHVFTWCGFCSVDSRRCLDNGFADF